MITSVVFAILCGILLNCGYSQAQCEQGCYNGGTCSGNTCRCADGWYGTKCHRPCQDVFKSCIRWKEEGRCEWDDQTKYFDDHCPHTCNNCVYDNKTIVEYPLAPILEPLQPFIGIWRGESDSPDHFPVDFISGGYDEEIRFSATDMPAFDRPSLNYSAKAVSKVDANDIQYDSGFLYIRPFHNFTIVGLMATSNSGIMYVQEGHLNSVSVKFITTYNTTLPYARLSQAHIDSTRTIELSGDLLAITVVNQGQSYVKYYRRAQDGK